MLLISSSFRNWLIAIIFAVVLVAAGGYIGARYVERDMIRNNLNDSILQIANNLETIKYLRDGKTANAINLINTNNEVKVLYLIRYEDVGSEDAEFIRRKKRVLSTLRKELVEHPRINGDKENSFKSGSEWENYQRDLEKYLESM